MFVVGRRSSLLQVAAALPLECRFDFLAGQDRSAPNALTSVRLLVPGSFADNDVWPKGIGAALSRTHWVYTALACFVEKTAASVGSQTHRCAVVTDAAQIPAFEPRRRYGEIARYCGLLCPADGNDIFRTSGTATTALRAFKAQISIVIVHGRSTLSSRTGINQDGDIEP